MPYNYSSRTEAVTADSSVVLLRFSLSRSKYDVQCDSTYYDGIITIVVIIVIIIVL